MKISFDAKRLFNNLTGLGNYSRTLVQNLQSQQPQNQYILYTPKARHNPDAEYFFNHNRFKIVVAPKGLVGKLWRSWGVWRNIRRDKPDIYHGLSHDLPFSIHKRHGNTTKYVVTIHDLCYKTFPEMFPPVERMIYRLKYRHSLKVADKIVAISESTRRDIVKYFPSVDRSKIEVIYQALNPVYYKELTLDEALEVLEKYGISGEYILYVGSINSRKNLLGIVQAYTLLPDEKRLPLVVIGSGGKYKEQVMTYAEQNEILQYINFIDNVTLPENLQAFYRCATMLVYPSFYEGFGLPVAEALLSHTPVITSNISSLPEAAGPGALYADPYSSESIAACIEQLIDNPEMAKQLACEGCQYVTKKFDAEKLTLQMLNLYNSL